MSVFAKSGLPIRCGQSGASERGLHHRLLGEQFAQSRPLLHPLEMCHAILERRKIHKIFAADIAGYSRLMTHDEIGTLDRLKACRAITSILRSVQGARGYLSSRSHGDHGSGAILRKCSEDKYFSSAKRQAIWWRAILPARR
jgi:hypothetical protein